MTAYGYADSRPAAQPGGVKAALLAFAREPHHLASRRKPEVQEFSDWVLGQAGDASRAHGLLRRGTALC